jgi:hypothetical protein
MTTYNVSLHREIRLTIADIEADSPEDAVTIARDTSTGFADRIADCDDLDALVDLAGDEDCRRSVTVDFEGERIRKAAPALLTALQGLIDYAENEAFGLENHKDSPEAEAEAERAWHAVEAAQAAIAHATASGITPADIDIDALLARRRQIAAIWDIEDVQSIRPELNDGQAWEVLQAADRYHDATIGISWDVLGCHADLLFGDAPETDDAGEA